MKNDRYRLEAILNDLGSTSAEKAVAQAQLAALERNDTASGDFSEANIFRLLWDDGVIDASEEYLRAYYLADPQTSIQWAWLAFWRDRLKSTSQTLRIFAKDRIQKFADDAALPADVRKAAGDLLAAFTQRKADDPFPAIQIPGSERWETMSHDELYFKRMVPVKQSFTDAFYTAR
jgi:hypothetical protein